VARAGRVVRDSDVRRDPAFRGLPPGHPEIKSFMGVPLRYRGRAFGNLYVANKRGAAEFTAEDQRKVEMLAERGALAIHTARLYLSEAQRRAWLQATIEQIPEGVLILDRDGKVMALNRALAALSRPEARGVDVFEDLGIFDIRSPEGVALPVEDHPIVRALERGELTLGRELLMSVSGGRLVPVLSNAAPVRDEQGEIIGATNVVQDITNLKELERRREEWASVVAHDLRQPVSTIALSAGILLKVSGDGLSESERKHVERIKTSAARLTRMIDDLLNASLIETEHLPIECRAVDLAALIDGVVDSLRESLPRNRIGLAAEGDQVAWIDSDRIHQVLTNLLSNAIKYGDAGREIRVASVERGDFVEVTVTNWGAGIPAGDLPTLFSRFERTRGARATGVTGLGLGLYIARGIVEAHGGRLWAESTPGGTTSFHFTVPRVSTSPGGGPMARRHRDGAASPALASRMDADGS
jgi:signal transduction histidine kinase